MDGRKYAAALGLISFASAAVILIFIALYPLVGYLVFQAAGGSYRPSSYHDTIRLNTLLVLWVLLLISLAVFPLLRKRDSSRV